MSEKLFKSKLTNPVAVKFVRQLIWKRVDEIAEDERKLAWLRSLETRLLAMMENQIHRSNNNG